MDRRTFLAVSGASMGTSIAGCLGDDDPEPDVVETVTARADNGVTFDPIRVSIASGEGVRWRNETSQTLQLNASFQVAEADSWSLSLQVMSGEESRAIEFPEPGIYTYHDATYNRFTLCGMVIVDDADPGDGTMDCE